MSTKKEAYDKTISLLKENSLILLDSYVEFKGQKHRVKCTKCSYEFTVYVQKSSIIGGCPYCSLDNFYVNKRKTFNKVKEKCNSLNLELLDNLHNFNLRKLHLRCKICGYVYGRAFHDNMTSCKKCSQTSFGIKYQKVIKCLDGLGFDIKSYSSEKCIVKCRKCGKEYSVDYRSDLVCKCACIFGQSVLILNRTFLGLKEALDNGYKLVTLGISKEDTTISCKGNHKIKLSSYDGSSCSLCKRHELFLKFKKTLDEYGYTLISEFNGHSNKRNNELYLVKCNKCQTEFETGPSQVRLCPKCKDRMQFRSFREIELTNYFESKGISVYKSYRITSSTTKFYEIDLYFPDYHLGVELNGYYWHSIKMHDKKYHKDKTEECLKQGIKIYHFWEDTSLGLIKSVLMSKLGLLRKVYARSLTLVQDIRTTEFFDYNHVDGSTIHFKSFSLCKDGEILCSLSLRKHKEGIEIARFASKRGITVVGGYSRLLKYAIAFSKARGYSKLISYCNRDLSPDSDDTFYSKYGFEFVGESSLIMKYYVSKRITIRGREFKVGIYSRQYFQKRYLIDYCKENNTPYEGISEVEIAYSLGIYAVYNSGNFKYSLNLI